MTNDCIFCKIIKEEIPSEKVYEDSNMLAFLDINPVNPGHTLVIPKEHHQWMYDVPNPLLEKLWTKSKQLMKKIKETMDADFVVLSVVGLDVPHFHIHILPRHNDDGLANFFPTKKYKDNEEMKQIAEKIKSNL